MAMNYIVTVKGKQYIRPHVAREYLGIGEETYAVMVEQGRFTTIISGNRTPVDLDSVEAILRLRQVQAKAGK